MTGQDSLGDFDLIESDTGSAEAAYTDDDVSPETQYTYRVKAVNAHGASQRSGYSSVTTPPDPALTPSGLNAKAVYEDGNSAGVELTWNAPAKDAASITGYEILRAVGEGELAILVADTGSAAVAYADASATEPGEAYSYQVIASRGEGKSQPSNTAWAFLPKATVTAQPSEPPFEHAHIANATEIWSDTLTVGTFTVAGATFLGWDDRGNFTGGGLTDQEFDYGEHTYNLTEISLQGGTLTLGFDDTGAGDLATKATRDKLTLHVGTTTFNLGSGTLNPAQTGVLWTNSGLTWTDGDMVELELTTTDPGAPTLTATSGPGKVTLSWTPPTSSGGSAITGYEYRQRTGDDYADDAWTAIPDSASLTTYDVTGLTAGAAYTFQLRARNSTGAGLYSEEVTATPQAHYTGSEIWSTTLTVKELTVGVGSGCRNGVTGKECSTLLDDDDFTYNGKTHQIVELQFIDGDLIIKFGLAPGDDVYSFELNADGSIFSFQNAMMVTAQYFTIALPGFVPFTADTVVMLSMTVDHSTKVPTTWSLIPSGLGDGNSFRLIFLSSGFRAASSSDIDVYNTFVQNQAANGHEDIQAHSATFRMLGSTEDVDARDNTRTTGTGVPIYWLGGAKVADDYADFYDGDWDEEATGRRQNGDSVSIGTDWKIWTGSAHDGTEAMNTSTDPPTSRALGNSGGHWVMHGRPNSNTSGHGPIEGATEGRGENRSVYGLSGVFTVDASLVTPNAPPEFTSPASFSVEENQTAVDMVEATDEDAGDTVSYAITGGADQAKFDFDTSSGDLTFKDAPDHENPTDAGRNNTYMVTITATGGTGDRALTTDQAITVTVTDVDETPAILTVVVTSSPIAEIATYGRDETIEVTVTSRPGGEE